MATQEKTQQTYTNTYFLKHVLITKFFYDIYELINPATSHWLHAKIFSVTQFCKYLKSVNIL